MKHIPVLAMVLALASCVSTVLATEAAASTADHTLFKELEGPFESGPEVTRACLECHTEAAKQIHKTKHWTWEVVNPDTGQKLGKRNVVNNFCISTQSNIAACSSCHVGYGWKDNDFDFASEENVDCLVCHDTTGAYDKKRLREGKSLNLRNIAKSVGRTSRTSCGTCHFRGGGGDAVKHGDLDPSMIMPTMFLDVHMDADGLNFSCGTCHTTDAHMIKGSRYTVKAKGADKIVVPGGKEQNRASCQSCHGHRPMKNEKLNDHTDKVACATCHVPTFARGDFPSKMWWDWSAAGKLDKDGKPFSKLDKAGNEIYSSKKGDFRWARDVVPEYVWFNGTVHFTKVGDKIDLSNIVAINRYEGNAEDPDARIWPVKVMRGKLPYDSKNMTLVPVQTTGEDGYWETFDWKPSIAKGMKAVGQDFSGEFGFVETTMMWPMAHMVAPKEQALVCIECHAKDGRLAKVAGMYLSGRDSWWWLDWAGYALIVLSLVGVLGHGALRIAMNMKRKG